MLSSLIIVFREMLEAALVIGVLFAATRQVPQRSRWIWGGALVGILGAAVVAFFTEAISGALQGFGQEVFNASILFLAALLISWHVIWMKQASFVITREIKAVGQAIGEGRMPLYTLALVSGLAVLREGAEVVLFLYGVLISGQSVWDVTVGSILGCLLGGMLGILIYAGLIRIPTKHVFSVTSLILILLASGMVAHALGYLVAAGIVPSMVEPVWDSSKFLSQQSFLGQTLHVLIGYMDRPSGIQVLGYFTTIGVISMFMKLFGGSKKLASVVSVFLVIGVLGFSSDVHATKKVYSPYVEQGELEVEYRGSYAIDDRDSKDGKFKNKLGVGYGLFERWFFEVYGEWENHPGSEDEDASYEATEIENKFQLTEQGQYFLDAGLLIENEFAAESEDQDEVKIALLLEKDFGKWSHRANPFVEYVYGGEEEAEDEWEAGLSWSTFYRLEKWFEPGIEIYWNYGELGESRSFDEQEFAMGPVAYGKIGDYLKYELGYLFGVSDASPDGEIKWIVEWEWKF